jgi:hypothetical protein
VTGHLTKVSLKEYACICVVFRCHTVAAVCAFAPDAHGRAVPTVLAHELSNSLMRRCSRAEAQPSVRGPCPTSSFATQRLQCDVLMLSTTSQHLTRKTP